MNTSTLIFRGTTPLSFRLSFSMVGFSFFINSEIAFSIWLFNLLSTAQAGLFNALGMGASDPALTWYSCQHPNVAHQGAGAMIALVLSGLWIARKHLRGVFRKAFRGDPGIDDSGEVLSYRTAVFGMLGGLVFMGIWLWQSGLPGLLVPLFLFVVFVIFLGVTRIVAQGGVAATRAPLTPSGFMVSGFGTTALGSSGIVSLSFTHIWAGDLRTFVMASCANGLKLSEGIGKNKRPLFWCMVAAILLSFGGSIYMVLSLAYKYGGINSAAFFRTSAFSPFRWASSKITSSLLANWAGWSWTGIGALVMMLLVAARHRFLWWPLHPLGFAVGAIDMTNVIWFSVFLAWLFKVTILKYGGARLYRKSRPFFLGLILGQFVVSGMWLVIDFFMGMTDNSLYWV